MTITVHDIGETVVCDFCNDDFTGKPDTGGLLFQSKAACPLCAPRIEDGAKRHSEERFIRARCPEGVTFQAFVLGIRAGDNRVITYTGEDALNRMKERS